MPACVVGKFLPIVLSWDVFQDEMPPFGNLVRYC
jgi:hypothetical protein